MDAVDHNIWVANGVCWSPDDTKMYFADPPPGTAHVLERTSVKLAVHEQREVDLTATGVLPMSLGRTLEGRIGRDV